jgi:cobaltochelatase CobT
MKINTRVAVMREVTTKVVQILAERKIKVTQQGMQAYVKYNMTTLEPEVVNIPYIPDDANEELIDAIQGFIDHELGHIFFTDGKSLRKARDNGVAQLHNAIEDTFIERKQAQNMKGSGLNLENVGRFFLKNFTDKKIKTDKKNIQGYLMIPAIRAWAGQLLFQEYMDDGDHWKHLEDVTKRLKPLLHELPHIKSSDEAVDLAIRMQKLLKDGEAPKTTPPKRGAESPSKKVNKTKSAPREEEDEKFEEAPSPEKKAEPGTGEAEKHDEEEDEKFEEKAEKDEKFDDSEPDEGGDAGDGEFGMAEFSEEEEDEAFEESSPSHESPSASGGELSGGGESKKDLSDVTSGMGDYDEDLSSEITGASVEGAKDSDYIVWSKDGDVIEDYVHTGSETSLDSSVKVMQAQSDAMVGVMQKDLERAMAAQSKSVWHSGLRRGRLNSSSLSKLILKDDRVFRRREEAVTKDTAVSLVVDCSGSMSGDKIQKASAAAFALSSVLDRMSIAHEVIGFTTKRDRIRSTGPSKTAAESSVSYSRIEPLYMPILKNFDDRLGPKTKRNIAAMQHADFLHQNVDGECVQIAAQRLAKRKERRHVMIVLSDGQPAAPGDGRALRNHLKSVVIGIQEAGIDIIGIGIQSNAVSDYYPKNVILNEVSDLAGEVMQKIRGLLLAK